MADQILPKLAEIVNDVVGIEPAQVTPEKNFVDDLDIDSLSMVEIIYACEEAFNVSIPDDDAKNLKTVGDAVSFIEKAQAKELRG